MPEQDHQFEPLEHYLSSLPSRETREYERRIAKCADYCSAHQKEGELLALLDSGLPIAFDAFFCMCTLYRRNRDFALMAELMQSHPEFHSYPLYNHIRIQYLVHSEAFYDYDALLQMAYDDARTFRDNSGFLQAFCNAFVTICENCNDDDRSRLVRNWYDTVLIGINQALENDPTYAKFYVTKARLIAQKGQYREADELLRKAISNEDSSRHDYAITIANYQYYRLRFHVDERLFLLASRMEQLETICSSLVAGGSENAEPGEGADEPDAYDGDAPFAFISYAHSDRSEVCGVLRFLQQRGIRFWYDKGIEPGEEWPEKVALRLAESGVVVVMLSAAALASANVRREVNLALSENKKLIVVQLDNAELSLGMKLQFGLFQMILKSNYSCRQFYGLIGNSITKELAK